MTTVIKDFDQLVEKQNACTKCLDDKFTGKDGKRHVVLCGGTGCLSSQSMEIGDKFKKKLPF